MKSRFLLTFAKELVGQPIIYQLVQQFGLELNILRANVDHNVEGRLLLDITGDRQQISSSRHWLVECGVDVKEVGKLIVVDEQSCVHCGACTAVCSPQALQMNQTTWLLELDSQKCVACAACVEVCPLRCVSLN